jgi:TPP-dependent 2-oxoacid decarboxylase
MTGITDLMLAKAPVIDEILPAFLEFAGKNNAFKIEDKKSLNSPNINNIFTNISQSLLQFHSVFLQIPVNLQKISTHIEDFSDIVSKSYHEKMKEYQQYVFSIMIHKWFYELFGANTNYSKIKEKKPIFLIGTAFYQYTKYIQLADNGFYQLMEEIGAKVFYTVDAKGILDENQPCVMGYYWGGVTPKEHLDLFKQSDARFYFGVEFFDYNSCGYTAMFEPTYVYQCKNVSVNNLFSNQLANKFNLSKTSNIISSAIQDNLTSLNDFFVETGSSWFYGIETKLPSGTRFNISMRYGSIGWCFPASVGNAFANPERKTLCLTGDGALQMTNKTIYLVKSSEELEDGSIYWENLRAFTDYDEAQAYRIKTLGFIQSCKDLDDSDEVIIEDITLYGV